MKSMNLLDKINDLHDWTETERGKRICTRSAWIAAITLVAYLIFKTAYDLTHHYTSSL
jgi:hypothetical protein